MLNMLRQGYNLVLTFYYAVTLDHFDSGVEKSGVAILDVECICLTASAIVH